MNMKQEWYTRTQAQKLLGIDWESLKYRITHEQFRAGVLARGWLGVWAQEGSHDGGDKEGEFGKEFTASQFWYLHHTELYEMLNWKNEKDISVLIPCDKCREKLLASNEPLITEKGFFLINSNEANRRITVENLLIHVDDINAAKFGQINANLPKPKLTQQIEEIENTSHELGFDLLSIPEGGKKKISGICLENDKLFTINSFEHAWKAAKKEGLIEVENVEQYKK